MLPQTTSATKCSAESAVIWENPFPELGLDPWIPASLLHPCLVMWVLLQSPYFVVQEEAAITTPSELQALRSNKQELEVLCCSLK